MMMGPSLPVFHILLYDSRDSLSMAYTGANCKRPHDTASSLLVFTHSSCKTYKFVILKFCVVMGRPIHGFFNQNIIIRLVSGLDDLTWPVGVLVH